MTANGDTITGVTETSTGRPASAAVAGSPYATIPTAAVGSGLGNYTVTYVDGKLTVNPAPLVITADSASKTYGNTATFASTAFTETGLVTANGNTITGVTETSTRAPHRRRSARIRSCKHGRGEGTGQLHGHLRRRQTHGKPGSARDHGRQRQQDLREYGDLRQHGVHRNRAGDGQREYDHRRDRDQHRGAASATVASSPYAIIPSAAVGSGLGNYTVTYVDGKLTVNPAPLVIRPTAPARPTGIRQPSPARRSPKPGW